MSTEEISTHRRSGYGVGHHDSGTCMQAEYSLVRLSGIDLNVQDCNNWTALHHAVCSNHPAIVSQLLSHDKMDASLKDDDNETVTETALKCAIDWENAQCVTILRQHGAPE